jgi:serine/threonine-protein kinase HipA
MRSLNVWWDGRVAGRLTQDRSGDMGFVYSEEWLAGDGRALSASLPKRAEPFSRRECRPFFGGLLPDEDQRDAAARALGVSAANDFAMLDRLGGDVAGALQLLPPGVQPQNEAVSARPQPLDEQGLIRVLDALPMRPLLAGEAGMRLSLAGAQAKVPVVLVDGKIALPLPGQPTTCILKPAIPRFPGSTENEAFVMRLAAAIGLDVAPVEPYVVGGRLFLLVARYDRAFTDGGVRRVHQEDFCQALGVPPETKYAAEGGPGFKECFTLLRNVSARPAEDVLKLLDAAIFNLIVGNADAHGKNFSLLYDAEGPRLAPLYDLLSTVAWPELSPKMAMKMGGRTRLEEMDEKGWSGFAGDAGISENLVRTIAQNVAVRISNAVETTLKSDGFATVRSAIAEKLADQILERAKRIFAA